MWLMTSGRRGDGGTGVGTLVMEFATGIDSYGRPVGA
jgi:hypothetical protein